jgi:hypothetical protein
MTASLTPYPACPHRGTSHVGHLCLFVMMYASTAPAQRYNTHCITHSSCLRAPSGEGELLPPLAGSGASTRRRSCRGVPGSARRPGSSYLYPPSPQICRRWSPRELSRAAIGERVRRRAGATVLSQRANLGSINLQTHTEKNPRKPETKLSTE